MAVWLKKILWICGMVPLLTAALASAQAPNGSYLRSCEQIQVNGTLLTATCNTGGNPGTLRTTINTAACGSGISNNSGWLSCIAHRGTWGEGHAVPSGTYMESCSRPFVNGTLLEANCKGRNGGFNRTEVNLARCKLGDNISNIDGQLVCIE